MRSCGYSFFFESLFVLHRNGFAIEEMPIALPARTYGSSKMSWRETVRSASRLLKLYWAAIRHPESFLLTSPLPPILAAELPLQDPQGWDTYWTRGQEKSRRAYSFVASLYRRLAIRRNLNYFIHKHFRARCAAPSRWLRFGQVDSELSREMRITAVDISLPALESYRRNNPGAEAVRHGDILHLDGVAGGSFDGAYNLGVVEHFTQDQIVQILREMGRTVKPGGKVVIFWPHRRAHQCFRAQGDSSCPRFLPTPGWTSKCGCIRPKFPSSNHATRRGKWWNGRGSIWLNITSECVTYSFKRSSSAANGDGFHLSARDGSDTEYNLVRVAVAPAAIPSHGRPEAR